jgi:hypothetical protein
MTSSKGLLVALVAHIMSECGLALLEFLRKYEGEAVGRCTFIDGLTNPINISLEAKDGGLELVVVGCNSAEGEGYEVKDVKPVKNSSNAIEIVVNAWAGFLGSSDVNNLALALKLVHSDEFKVVKLQCLNIESCRNIISNLLSNLCTHPEP